MKRSCKLLMALVAVLTLALCCGIALAEDTPTFTIGDHTSSGTFDALVCEHLDYDISALGMTAAKLEWSNEDGVEVSLVANECDRDRWEKRWQPLGYYANNDLTVDFAGTRTVKAYVSYDQLPDPLPDDFDWDVLNWVEASQTYTINFLTTGEIDPPQVEEAPTTVNRGGHVYLRVLLDDYAGVEIEDYYAYAYVTNDNGDEEWVAVAETNDDWLTISTANLEAGDYNAKVRVRAIGCEQVESVFPFTVVDDSASEDRPVYFSINHSTLQPDRTSERSNMGSALQAQIKRRTTATLFIPHTGIS
jgi:hypothetical protein